MPISTRIIGHTQTNDDFQRPLHPHSHTHTLRYAADVTASLMAWNQIGAIYCSGHNFAFAFAFVFPTLGVSEMKFLWHRLFSVTTHILLLGNVCCRYTHSRKWRVMATATAMECVRMWRRNGQAGRAYNPSNAWKPHTTRSAQKI